MDQTHRLSGRVDCLLRCGSILGQFMIRSRTPSDLPPVARRVTQTRPSAMAVTTALLANWLSTAQQSRPRRRLQDAGLVRQIPL